MEKQKKKYAHTHTTPFFETNQYILNVKFNRFKNYI